MNIGKVMFYTSDQDYDRKNRDWQLLQQIFLCFYYRNVPCSQLISHRNKYFERFFFCMRELAVFFFFNNERSGNKRRKKSWYRTWNTGRITNLLRCLGGRTETFTHWKNYFFVGEIERSLSLSE